MLFRSRKRKGKGTGGQALAEPAPNASCDDLLAELDRLSADRDGHPNPEIDQRLLGVRHRAGLAMVARGTADAQHAAPELDRFGPETSVPEVRRDELSPEVLRGAILSRGCLLVRGLVGSEDAREFREEMERAFTTRDAARAGEPAVDGYFDEFVPDPRYDLGIDRVMVSDPNGMWVADSPRLAAEWFDLLRRAGFLELATGYLGERPAISVNKSTLRRVKADPDADYSLSHWHQDGAFLGQVRALNIWLSLSHCGDVAPGLDLVPIRLDHIVPTGTEGAVFDWSVSTAVVEETAAQAGITRPVFEPGDALLFDDLFLHATGASPEMTDTRYAVECWFFGPSAFPAEYPPLAS
jgi:hypothetical protein